MRRPHVLIAAVLAAAILLGACGDDDTASTSTGDTSHMNDGMGQDSMGQDSMGQDSMGHDGMGAGGASPVVPGARRIEVTGASFAFDPDQITVQAGEDIAIVLTSVDIVHDFTIDELDVHVAADSGETEEGGLRADEPGRYTYYCSVSGHRAAGMEGTLVVD